MSDGTLARKFIVAVMRDVANLMGRYSRAKAQDFDDWNVPGWAAKDIIPFMQKVCQSSRRKVQSRYS